jgi:predicted nucleic acid-binding Zn finger protein
MKLESCGYYSIYLVSQTGENSGHQLFACLPDSQDVWLYAGNKKRLELLTSYSACTEYIKMTRFLMALRSWQPNPMHAYLQGLMVAGKHYYLPAVL